MVNYIGCGIIGDLLHSPAVPFGDATEVPPLAPVVTSPRLIERAVSTRRYRHPTLLKWNQLMERTFAQLRETLYSAVVADACDQFGLRNQSIQLSLPPQTTTGVMIGRCRTSTWEDIFSEDPSPYELELKLVDSCQTDDVVISAAGGSTRSGIWGELLSTAASNRGCAGVIVDGAVRDVQKMRAMEFPVFAAARCVYDSCHRQRVNSIDEPVEVGGVTICSGDIVVADEDGVVIVPQAKSDEILAAAWDKVHAENVTRDAIKEGMGAIEAYEKYGVL